MSFSEEMLYCKPHLLPPQLESVKQRTSQTPNAKRQTPNPKRQKFWTDRSVVRILIFLDKFEKISSTDFIVKKLKTISSAEFIDADFIEKKFALLISLKKIPTVDFIEKNFSNPKPQHDRPVVFKRQTPIFTDRPAVPFFVSYQDFDIVGMLTVFLDICSYQI